MNDNQKLRFKKLLGIKPDSFDTRGELLNKVIELDVNLCDDELELTFEDFEEYFYVENIKSFENNLKSLRENILSGRKYHYLHSYGKNGKSTFIRIFKKANEKDFMSVILNFKDFQIAKSERKHSLISKTIDFLYTLGDIFNDKLIDIIEETLIHIENSQLEIKPNTISNELRTNYNHLFRNFKQEFLEYILIINEQIKLSNPGIENPKKKMFFRNFENFIEGFLLKKRLDIIEFFNFLILITIRLYGDENKKTVIIFENIDDILTHSSEYLTSSIFPQVDIFLTVISKYLNEKKVLISDSIIDNIAFIFVYRSANFVSSIFHINYNPSANFQKRKLLNAPLYRISTVNNAGEILRKKINFYENICKTFNIDKSPGFDYLNNILETIENDSILNQSLFKLWNGNQYAFIEFFKSMSLSPFDFEFTKNPNISNYVKNGALIFQVVKYYTWDRHKFIIPESTLSSAFQYAFTLESCQKNEICKCNLLRLFLSYIINYNEKNIKNGNENYEAGTVLDKGISLKEILDKFTQFKLNGEIVYNKELFQDLFSKLFHDDIDEFDYFITCIKSTDIRIKDEIFFGKKYDFTEELDLYFKYFKTDESKLQSLKSVRIYYNINSKYFINYIKKHFEFFSCYIQDNSRPLTYNIKVYKTQPVSNLFSDSRFTFNYTINNSENINQVFQRVENTLHSITQFYVNAILPVYPPIEYCKKSNFALNDSFHFDDLISKHVTYIEKVRQHLLNGSIPFSYQKDNSIEFVNSNISEIPIEILQNINGLFIFWIEKYMKLFFSIFSEIKQSAKNYNKKMDYHSKSTKKSFKYLMTLIQKIKSSNFKDFITKVETSDEKKK